MQRLTVPETVTSELMLVKPIPSEEPIKSAHWQAKFCLALIL